MASHLNEMKAKRYLPFSRWKIPFLFIHPGISGLIIRNVYFQKAAFSMMSGNKAVCIFYVALRSQIPNFSFSNTTNRTRHRRNLFCFFKISPVHFDNSAYVLSLPFDAKQKYSFNFYNRTNYAFIQLNKVLYRLNFITSFSCFTIFLLLFYKFCVLYKNSYQFQCNGHLVTPLT